jgi:hypothetical protein
VGVAVSRFGYLRDRLFVAAVAGYALNRWLLKPRLSSPFLHDHFNDLLLIPAALPVVLWVQRVMGLRKHDLAPSWTENGFASRGVVADLRVYRSSLVAPRHGRHLGCGGVRRGGHCRLPLVESALAANPRP